MQWARHCQASRVSIRKFAKVFMLKVFYMMGKALSDKLSCTWTGLVSRTDRYFLKSKGNKTTRKKLYKTPHK